MELIDFCDKYCPIPARWVEFPKIDNQLSVDCDLEESECPFHDVDFSKVVEAKAKSNNKCALCPDCGKPMWKKGTITWGRGDNRKTKTNWQCPSCGRTTINPKDYQTEETT